MSLTDFLELSTWAGWWDQVTATPSNVIAIAAVVVSLMSARATSKHGRLSVLPAFSVWAEYPSAHSNSCEITFSNKGFGPAIIDSVELWNGIRQGEGQFHLLIQNVIEEVFAERLEGDGYWSNVQAGHAFGQGDEITLAKFNVDNALAQSGIDQFSGFLAPIKLVVRYHDIYRRKWVYTVDQFIGYTYRAAWWSPRYLWARLILRRRV